MHQYLCEEEANEELIPIILVSCSKDQFQESFLDWDESMQLECAESFVKPVEMDVSHCFNKQLLSRGNKEILIQKSLEVIGDRTENENLLNSWTVVFTILIKKLPLDYLFEEVFD